MNDSRVETFPAAPAVPVDADEDIPVPSALIGTPDSEPIELERVLFWLVQQDGINRAMADGLRREAAQWHQNSRAARTRIATAERLEGRASAFGEAAVHVSEMLASADDTALSDSHRTDPGRNEAEK